ncbi:hypothetical protein [Luteibaculum oceani]|uniref:Peptidyl-prolyl cis-trans isomerase n=1 Tax=Luteibaculum oceani TaxID=1294296 RepID=A0A5C6V7W9_9FLAO|nr:hypothetical protein [Luteibaculum oceani]TXC81372.1 hypothetical protein FRX97_05040 [Luteibaculum oceani]
MGSIKGFSILTFACILLIGCDLLKRGDDKGKPVARVNERVLYEKDLPIAAVTGLPKDDSARVVKRFIESWVKEQVLVMQAEENLLESMDEIEERINSYRNSLIVYEYERAVLQNKLDTAISSDEVVSYYRENQSNFMLQEPAFRFYYIGLESTSHEPYRVIRALRSLDPVKIEELKAYGLGHGAIIYFEDENWVSLSNLNQAVGIKLDPNKLLKGDPLKIITENGVNHYLYVLEIKEQGEFAPVSLVEGEIRAKIINDRKFDLINTMRNDLFKEALNKRNAEIY